MVGRLLRVQDTCAPWLALRPQDVSYLLLFSLAATPTQPPRRRTRTYLWAGLGFLVVQWGVLARLTFWELSWDVIEPITYFLGSATTVLLYCYFMVCRPTRDW